jgi:pimeloyl-ACP methyl ester carboxylesterase
MAQYDRTVQTNDAAIRVTDTGGKGMPLVMIHGSGSNRNVFAKQMSAPDLLSFRLIALDLPGHGESSDAERPRETYTLPGLARAVSETMTLMGLGPSVVYGWSLGGHVALEMMSFDSRMAGLMITGAAPISRGPLGILRGLHSTAGTRLAGKQDFSDADVELFARTCLGDTVTPDDIASIRRADGRLRRIMFRSMLTGRCADEKRVVETDGRPVGVVNGRNEPFAKLGYVAALNYRALWHGMCHVLPGAGHTPFRTHTAQFNALLAQFAYDVAAGQGQREPIGDGVGAGKQRA